MASSSNQPLPYPEENPLYPQEGHAVYQQAPAAPGPTTATASSMEPQPSSAAPYASPGPLPEAGHMPPEQRYDDPNAKFEPPPASFEASPTSRFGIGRLQGKKISKKWQKRLYWIIPLCILTVVLVVLFEVYKSDFERWLQPLADWLSARDSWSWTIPVGILVILSFPPLFGHEIVQLLVGIAYPLGVALGIAIAGSVLGEAACFVVFKYFFTGYAEKKIARKTNWAAVARVAQSAGFRGILVIRYSIVPPHLANPLFACTGMKFWLYMVTVILSLPKSLVFVALGSPSSKNSKAAKWGKAAAIFVVVVITLLASIWIRKHMKAAVQQIEAERGITHDDEEMDMLGPKIEQNGSADTSYHGIGVASPYPHTPHTPNNDTTPARNF